MKKFDKRLARAYARIDAGEYAQAVKILAKLVVLAPQPLQSRLHLELGVCYVSLEEFHAALTCITFAIKSGNDEVVPGALALKATTLERLNQLNQACDAYEEYFKRFPTGKVATRLDFGKSVLCLSFLFSI